MGREKRLLSLDILRGLDLFLLVFFQPVFISLARAADADWLNAVVYQFDHEVWAGFRFWDLVMPLFLFMAGAALPFSFKKYTQKDNRVLWLKRIAKRVILLYLLGGVVQGNFLGLDPQHIYLYSNTLQAIAAGYLIAGLVIAFCNRKNQWIAFALILLLYWIPMTLSGDFTPEGNFAEKVDCAVLGRFRDMVYRDAEGAWYFSDGYTYTWILSSLNFGGTVLLGLFAGQMIMYGKQSRRIMLNLLVFGAVLVAGGLLLSLQMPIIKRIWTTSMTLFSGGLCVLLLALFYYVADVRRCTKGLLWLQIYGTNSIAAYLMGECINFRSVVQSLSYGLQFYTGDYYTVIVNLGNYSIVFLILLFMYRHKIFLKV